MCVRCVLSAINVFDLRHGGARPRFTLGRSNVERCDGNQGSERRHSHAFDQGRRNGRIHEQEPPFSAANSGAMTIG